MQKEKSAVVDSQTKPQQLSLARAVVCDATDRLDYLHVVWRYRGMILVLCILGISLAAIRIWREPRLYQSVVTIMPPFDVLQKELGGLESLNNPLLRQVMDTGAVGIAKLYVQILQSREVTEGVVDRCHLTAVYENTRSRSGAREQLRDNTQVKMTDGGAVRIAVVDRDPNRSAVIARTYVEELDRQNKRLSASRATSKRIFLENRLKEVEGTLSKIDSMPSHKAQIQEMLYELLMQQYEMAKIEEARSMPTIQVLDPATVPESPVGRDVAKRGVMAGVAAFTVGVFFSFVVDHIVRVRRYRAVAKMTGPGVPTRTRASQDLTMATGTGSRKG